jgi:hypothetical protein
MHLAYGLQTAHMGCNETRHPQVVMKELGITYQHATPQSMGDMWQFWNCQNVPEKLPDYLAEFKTDPMDHIGYGLSEADAIKIKNGETK